MDPIRRTEDIQAIKLILSRTPRDLLLFTMGINNGLRAGDLLMVKVKDVKSLKPGEFITIKENKTGKQNILMVNKFVHKALQNYLEKVRPEDDDYLFASRKTKEPLTIQAVNAMLKKWTRLIHLDYGNYGAHTLKEDFWVHAAHKIRGGLRGPGQAVQPLQPHYHHAVSWPYER